MFQQSTYHIITNYQSLQHKEKKKNKKKRKKQNEKEKKNHHFTNFSATTDICQLS